jgi:hypothetical protein
MPVSDRLRRTVKRGLRGLLASLVGLAAAKYGQHPLWGPCVTAAALMADKYLRTAPNGRSGR